jgi:hypothetical protein
MDNIIYNWGEEDFGFFRDLDPKLIFARAHPICKYAKYHDQISSIIVPAISPIDILSAVELLSGYKLTKIASNRVYLDY